MGSGRQSARDDRILCAVVGVGAVCFGMEVSNDEKFCTCCFVRRLCVAGVRLVQLLVHYRSSLSLGLERLARIDARRVGAASGLDH